MGAAVLCTIAIGLIAAVLFKVFHFGALASIILAPFVFAAVLGGAILLLAGWRYRPKDSDG